MAAFGKSRVLGIFLWASFLAAGPCISGCAGLAGSGAATHPVDLTGIELLLVAPFDAFSPHRMASMNRCPVCNAVVSGGAVEPGAADYMTRQLMAHLKATSDYDLLGPGMATGVRARIISTDVGVSRRRLLVQMGREIGADAVVSGVVYRFEQRVGTALSVESAASAGFGVHLLRCSDGRLLWSDHFDETQHNLSENLFELPSFVKRGGQWLTVEKLAAYGLSEIMKGFPAPK